MINQKKAILLFLFSNYQLLTFDFILCTTLDNVPARTWIRCALAWMIVYIIFIRGVMVFISSWMGVITKSVSLYQTPRLCTRERVYYHIQGFVWKMRVAFWQSVWDLTGSLNLHLHLWRKACQCFCIIHSTFARTEQRLQNTLFTGIFCSHIKHLHTPGQNHCTSLD